MRAQDIMTSPVTTVSPQTPAHDAAALLDQHGFTALPVVNEAGELVGIVTEADLLQHRIHRSPPSRFWHRKPTVEPPPGRTVSDVMTSPAVAMSPQTDTAHLAQIMLREKLRSIPIVSSTRLTGIVTRRDLLRTIIRSDADIAEDLRQCLQTYSGPQRWTVSVTSGVADLIDEAGDESDHNVVTMLAQAIPGVAQAAIRSRSTKQR